MRRAILTLGSTAAGLAALLSFKTHSTAATVADPGSSPAAASASASGALTGPAGTSSPCRGHGWRHQGSFRCISLAVTSGS